MARTLNTEAVWVATFSERWLLPLIYFGFAYTQWMWASREWHGVWTGSSEQLGLFVNDATLLALNLTMGVVLLIARRPTALPRTISEILVPLAASYYFVLFSGAPLLPRSLQWLDQNRAPLAWRVPLSYAGLAMGAVGTALAIWGLVSLGRSFGIFVAVRGVVLRGPYRWVRHPMYAGYIVASIGLMLADASLAMAVLVPIQAALFVWRASLEETRLAGADERYSAYRRSTGFLVPRMAPTRSPIRGSSGPVP